MIAPGELANRAEVLTPRQAEAVEFVERFVALTGERPTFRQVAARLNCSRTSAFRILSRASERATRRRD